MTSLLFLFVAFFVALASTCATPIADYVFSQQGCKDATWVHADGLTFTRQTNVTSCPSFNGFEYWTTGVYSTQLTGIPDAIVSNEITDQFEELSSTNTDPAVGRSMTMATWFTKTEILSSSDTYILTEFSPSTQPSSGPPCDTPAVDPENTKVQMRLYSPEQRAVFSGWMQRTPLFGPIAAEFTDTGQFTAGLGTYALFITQATPPTTGVSITTSRIYKWNGHGTAPTLAGSGTGADDQRMLQLMLDPTNKIRLCSNRYASTANCKAAVNTWFHRFATWNRSLSVGEIPGVAQSGMPNAVASAKNCTFTVVQNVARQVNLNTSACVTDAEGQAIIAIRIHSLPGEGYLQYNGANLSSLPYTVVNPILLTYTPSYGTWTSDCASILFRFDASDDGVRYSVTTTYAFMCIPEVNIPPVVVSANYSVANGGTQNFSVLVTDQNDLDTPPSVALGVLNATTGGYRDTTFVSFQSVIGTHGRLFEADCTVPLVAQANYTPAVEFCFVASSPTSMGIDVFLVTAFDAVSSSLSPGQIRFENLTPLQAYGTNVTTLESPETVDFTLPVYDGLDRSPLVPQIVTLPSNGVLTFTDNESLVAIGDLVDGNLTCTGNSLYFNCFEDGCLNFYGESPGPLDSFTYVTRYENESSEAGPVYVTVINTFSEITSVSGLTGRLTMVLGDTYEFGDRIQVVDPDDQAYLIGVLLYSAYGVFLFDVTQEELLVTGPDDNSLILGFCGPLMDAGCGDISFAARPRYVNYLLRKMQFQLDFNGGTTTSLRVSIFKPSPEGMTEANFVSTFLDATPDATANLPIDVTLNTPTASPNSSGSDPTLLILILVCMVLSCVGALCFMFLMCCMSIVFAYDRMVAFLGALLYYGTCQCIWRRCKGKTPKTEETAPLLPPTKTGMRGYRRRARDNVSW